jgi:hypothetical protein
MIQNASESQLEIEGQLQVDAPVRGGRGEEASSQRVRLTEKRRIEYTNGLCKINVIEDITCHCGKGQ